MFYPLRKYPASFSEPFANRFRSGHRYVPKYPIIGPERIKTTFGTYQHHVRNLSMTTSERIGTTSRTYQRPLRNLLRPSQEPIQGIVRDVAMTASERITLRSERTDATSWTYQGEVRKYEEEGGSTKRFSRRICLMLRVGGTFCGNVGGRVRRRH